MISNGGVVQLDRITDFGSVGWGFESSLPHRRKTHKELWVLFYNPTCLNLILYYIEKQCHKGRVQIPPGQYAAELISSSWLNIYYYIV